MEWRGAPNAMMQEREGWSRSLIIYRREAVEQCWLVKSIGPTAVSKKKQKQNAVQLWFVLN
jgi:hypothetical protein